VKARRLFVRGSILGSTFAEVLLVCRARCTPSSRLNVSFNPAKHY
jgi:hypothetical protein